MRAWFWFIAFFTSSLRKLINCSFINQEISNLSFRTRIHATIEHSSNIPPCCCRPSGMNRQKLNLIYTFNNTYLNIPSRIRIASVYWKKAINLKNYEQQPPTVSRIDGLLQLRPEPELCQLHRHPKPKIINIHFVCDCWVISYEICANCISFAHST